MESVWKVWAAFDKFYTVANYRNDYGDEDSMELPWLRWGVELLSLPSFSSGVTVYSASGHYRQDQHFPSTSASCFPSCRSAASCSVAICFDLWHRGSREPPVD